MKKFEFVISVCMLFILTMILLILNYVDVKKIEDKNRDNFTTNDINLTLSNEEEVIDINEENEENEENIIVYDGMTEDELAEKLDKSLHSTLAGTGHIYVRYCLEYGVDPYLAVAISLHETGCVWTCSEKVTKCNNVGGQRFKPTCYSGGTYGKYDTLEDGIKGFIANLAHNYIDIGLTTAAAMQDKYVGTGTTTWAPKVESYIEKIKNA